MTESEGGKPMYEELIKKLREAPGDWPDAELHYEAADAIEELNKQLKEYHKYDSFLAVHGLF